MKSHAKRLLLLPLLLLPACVEPTMRDGRWELSYVGVKLHHRSSLDPAGQDFPVPTRLVNVRLEPGPEGTEMAQLDFQDESEEAVEGAAEEGAAPEEMSEEPATAGVAIKPMFADIRRTIEGKPPTIHIEAKDGTWMWRMWGVITAPEEVHGSHFSAINRSDTDVTLQGHWRMRWLGEW